MLEKKCSLGLFIFLKYSAVILALVSLYPKFLRLQVSRIFFRVLEYLHTSKKSSQARDPKLNTKLISIPSAHMLEVIFHGTLEVLVFKL